MEESEKIQVPNEVVRIVEVSSANEAGPIIRLTPTGKISHAKTRVYTQRYRKEWEEMNDFKDWLASVPDEPTRAYCKFCCRNLHAHRLSLLKHMCTLKHQRAAVQYSRRVGVKLNPNKKIKRERNISYNSNCSQEDEDEEIYEEFEQEDMEASDNEIEEFLNVNSDLEKEKDEDTKPIKSKTPEHNSDFETDASGVHLRMVVESENEDNDDNNDSTVYEVHEQKCISDNSESDEINQEVVNSEGKVISGEISDAESSLGDQKMYIISADGSSYTLVKGSLVSKTINPVGEKIVPEIVTQSNNSKITTTTTTTTKTDTTIKNSRSKISKGPIVSTHVLDTSKGIPVNGLQVILYKLSDGKWNLIHESITGPDGLCTDFSKTLTPGRYKFHYDVEKYYNTRKMGTIFPFIEIVFDVKDPQRKYHIPLLLSPYSYTTHRDIFR